MHLNPVLLMNLRINFLTVVAILSWFALVSQFILLMQNRIAGINESIIRYFSYFTIEINLLVAVCVTSQLLKKPGKIATFFLRPSVQTAATLYIMVVAIVYNIILRQLISLDGFSRVVDELLHLIIPILMVIYWWKWVNTHQLNLKIIPLWLLYPALYCLYILWRGSLSGFYPYPFMNVSKLGYNRVWINCAGIVGVFLLFSLLLVLAGRKKNSDPLL
jgi:hypothetical protein